MKKDRYKVYCAGPLFNPHEREEMGEIAKVLQEAGFDVFLPHRDGMLFSEVYQQFLEGGHDPEASKRMIFEAIFALDVYEVLSGCDALVFNMNGRVPDEGAVSEAAMAWAMGKPVILYKSDVRSMIMGNDNPLVAGLSHFLYAKTVTDMIDQLRNRLKEGAQPLPAPLPLPVENALERGKSVAEAGRGGLPQLVETIRDLFGPSS
ncbi:MAG: nucleoside 2-deoxyribosyltransferase [Candidatus Tectomicrobia bacterium]|nr:nucleoside 2-deoxyribosyltransferase [Candidatus Tectomicrobia bacterium]